MARIRAFRQINRWQMNPKWALALNRHALTQRFGSLAALLWAQHISGRFRCAVSKDTNRLTGTDTDFARFFFLIAAEAVSGAGLCRVHELLVGFLLLALAFSLKS